MFIKTRHPDHKVIMTNNRAPFPPEKGFIVYSQVSNNILAGDYFDGIVHKPSGKSLIDGALIWKKVTDDWADNGELRHEFSDRLIRVIKLGDKSKLTKDEWKILSDAYGSEE